MEKLKEWWNGLSTREKIALGVLTAGVIGYALYIRYKNSQAQTVQPEGGSTSTDSFGNPLNPLPPGALPPAQLPPGPLPPQPGPTPQPGPGPVPPGAQFVTVAPWSATNPPWNSTFSGIANHEHETIDALKALNPQITNINLLHPGDQVRVA